MDIIQVHLRWPWPILFGFGNNPETRYFYGQAASEAAVIATTDCNAA